MLTVTSETPFSGIFALRDCLSALETSIFQKPTLRSWKTGGVSRDEIESELYLKNDSDGFRWVPGSGSEPKKRVPVGSGFQVGTQKVGSGGFRVPTKIFLCRPLIRSQKFLI